MFKNISRTLLSCAGCFSWLRTTSRLSKPTVAQDQLVLVSPINDSLIWTSFDRTKIEREVVFINPVPINNESSTFNPFEYLGEESLQYPQKIDLASFQIQNFNQPFVRPVRITNQDLAPHQDERMSPPPSPNISPCSPGFVCGPSKTMMV